MFDFDYFKEYLKESYVNYQRLLSESKDDFMQHYFQGKLDFISQISARFHLDVIDFEV